MAGSAARDPFSARIERIRSRISSRASGIGALFLPAGLPPFAEGLGRKGAQVANAGPVAEHAGEIAHPSVRYHWPLPEAAHALRGFESRPAGKDGSCRFHGQNFGIEGGFLFAHHTTAEMDQDFRD